MSSLFLQKIVVTFCVERLALRELKLGLLKIEVRQSGRMKKRTVVLHNTEKHTGCLAVLSRLALTLEKMLN